MPLSGYSQIELLSGRRRGRGRATRTAGATRTVRVGLDFGDDRRDRGIGGNHGCVHFLAESVHLCPEIVAGWLARIVSLLHFVHQILFFGGKGGVGRYGSVMRLVQFLLFGIGQEIHPMVVVEAAWRGWVTCQQRYLVTKYSALVRCKLT